jgi:hypothetical protein
MTRKRGDTQPFGGISSRTLVDGTKIYLETATSLTFTYMKGETEINLVATITDAAKGEYRFDPSETDFDTKGTFAYDIQIIYDDGVKTTPDSGDLIIEDDVNKA